MQQLLIGIDGGGTKTDFVLCEVGGTVINRVVLGNCNPNDVGISNCCKLLRQGIGMLGARGLIRGVYAGISGVLTENYRRTIEEFLSFSYPGAVTGAASDAVNILSSGLRSGSGIALISGTGSFAFARVGGEIHRVGGWGYLFEDAGSGFDLGRQAVAAALGEFDGSGEVTLLSKLLREQFGMPVQQAVGKLLRMDRSQLAALAPLVFDAFRQGDKPAEVIIRKTARRLAALVESCAKLCESRVVVAGGGLFRQADILLPMIRESLTGEYRFILPELPPVFGAAVECRILIGEPADDVFEETFARSLKGLCNHEHTDTHPGAPE